MVRQAKDRKSREVNDNLAVLRKALFAENGRDKDVTLGISPAFLAYDRNGIDLGISFSPKLDDVQVDWAFDLVKERMESMYDLSGYGWDDEDKRGELTEAGARFLLVFDRQESSAAQKKLVGFVHFRFTVQGEVVDTMEGDTCIFVWDIQIEDAFQCKGVGRHLLMLLELIGAREGIKRVSIPIQNTDISAKSWVEQLKGYLPDQGIRDRFSFDPLEEGFDVFSKTLKGRQVEVQSSPIPIRIAEETPSPVAETLVSAVAELNLGEETTSSSAVNGTAHRE